LQRYVVKRLNQPYWVNTELYSTSQIQQYDTTYAPYQTIHHGILMSDRHQPVRLGVWTFYDRDFSAIEPYRSYINGSMAVAARFASIEVITQAAACPPRIA